MNRIYAAIACAALTALSATSVFAQEAPPSEVAPAEDPAAESAVAPATDPGEAAAEKAADVAAPAEEVDAEPAAAGEPAKSATEADLTKYPNVTKDNGPLMLSINPQVGLNGTYGTFNAGVSVQFLKPWAAFVHATLQYGANQMFDYETGIFAEVYAGYPFANWISGGDAKYATSQSTSQTSTHEVTTTKYFQLAFPYHSTWVAEGGIWMGSPYTRVAVKQKDAEGKECEFWGSAFNGDEKCADRLHGNGRQLAVGLRYLRTHDIDVQRGDQTFEGVKGTDMIFAVHALLPLGSDDAYVETKYQSSPVPVGFALTLGGRAGTYVNSRFAWRLQAGFDAYGSPIIRGSFEMPIGI